MISFHGDQKIKEKYLARVMAHQDADELVRGIGWANGKGCAVGCTLEDYNHNKYESELGIPEWLARLEDALFEGMNLEKSKTWPEEFLRVIPVGIDLERVKKPFLIFILSSVLSKFDHGKFPEVKKAVDNVIHLIQTNASREELIEARRAAAAAYAAYAAAAAAYAAYAAAAAADAAAYAAAYAADAAYAAYAAAYAADAAAYARIKAYDSFSDKLLELLRGVK